MCVEDILTSNVSLLDRDEVKIDLTLVNLKNFALISNIILPNMLTLFYPVRTGTLAVIYWNSREALKSQRENPVDVSQLYKIMVYNVGQPICKTFEFQG